MSEAPVSFDVNSEEFMKALMIAKDYCGVYWDDEKYRRIVFVVDESEPCLHIQAGDQNRAVDIAIGIDGGPDERPDKPRFGVDRDTATAIIALFERFSDAEILIGCHYCDGVLCLGIEEDGVYLDVNVSKKAGVSFDRMFEVDLSDNGRSTSAVLSPNIMPDLRHLHMPHIFNFEVVPLASQDRVAIFAPCLKERRHMNYPRIDVMVNTCTPSEECF